MEGPDRVIVVGNRPFEILKGEGREDAIGGGILLVMVENVKDASID